MKNVKGLKDRLVASRYFSFGITAFLFIVLYAVGMMNYRGFLKPQVFCNLFIDNAALIIATVGITFVLLIGGIDISIGSVVALTCMTSAQLLANTNLGAGVVTAVSYTHLLACIESYLYIQQIRYADILSYEIDASENTLGFEIQKLSLQPLVENALYHGIKNKRGGGKICVQVRLAVSYTHLDVYKRQSYGSAAAG